MSLGTSKTILKIFGIFDIICGVLVLALAGLALAGISQAGTGELGSDSDVETALAGLVVLLVLGLIGLLEGIFSIRGAKDPAKIMPAWIFAIIGVITGVTGLFAGGSGGATGGTIGTLIINIVIFIAANNIKKSRNAN